MRSFSKDQNAPNSFPAGDPLTRLRADPELARKEPTFELRYQWVWGSVNGRKAPENGSQGRSSRKLIIICSPVMQTM